MPSGALLSAFAYEVTPRETGSLLGGEVDCSPHLQGALDLVFDRSGVSRAPVVTLDVDTSSRERSHPIRDGVLSLAFGTGSREDVVILMAERLAQAMDNRSKPCLLMVSVHGLPAAGARRILLWTFPRQQVFNLRISKGRPRLDLMEAFNQESSLRKVAMLEGTNTRTSMLTARVLDFQAAAAERSVADLWISRFLAARLQMSATEGTHVLARALRAAHDKTRDDPHAQDEIHAAIVGLRVARNQRHSLDQVEAAYLTGEAAIAFRASADPEIRSAVFTLDNDTFDRLLQFTRFTLDSGVVVSAPFVQLGSDGAVQVTDRDGRRLLRVEGTIEHEQVRSRA